MSTSRPALHQVCVSASPGDAITDHALMLRRWLVEMGFVSELFAEHIHPALARQVRPLASYRPRGSERCLIYHHGVGSPVADHLIALPIQLLLIYHNLTPAEFFAGADPEVARQMAVGRQQLAQLRVRTLLACGVSQYSTAELRAAGFDFTAVLPLALHEVDYSLAPDPAMAARYEGRGPLLLFVGRLVPNKMQEDLIKLFYWYSRIQPTARLVLVGSNWLPSYGVWLRDLARDLDLAGGIEFTGYVTHSELVSYYRLADLYVSMSEHEGFGKPFIESMYLGLPIMAYAAAAVPDTLGDAGVLFHRKHFEALAELVDLLMIDQTLRERVITRQRERVQQFLEPAVRKRWETILGEIGM